MLPRVIRLLRPLRSPSRHSPRTVRPVLEELEMRLAPSVNVLTYHDDIASTGLNAAETQLTPANVTAGSFGKLYSTAVDGQVYAEPLIQTGVTIASGPNTTPGAAGIHDVVFVATEHDSLYAIDASPGGGQVLWQRSFLDAGVAANNTLGATVISTVPSGDIGTGDISPEIGITGTPVIDGATGTLYVVAKTRETINGTNHYVQRLHAINVSDGTDRVTPYLIGDTVADNSNSTAIYVYGSGDGSVTDPYNGTGKPVVQFNALHEAQRGGLSLVNKIVYVQWASHGDNGPYHGWVAAWDVSNLAGSGMVLKGVLNTSPNNGLSGVWQGGGRLVFEADGSAFYFETGNGSGGPPTLNSNGFPSNANYNEALVKVVADSSTGPTHQNSNGWGLKIADYFIPFNVAALDGADSDFGSGAPILLPDSAGIPSHPHLMIVGGKEGKLYVLDRDNLGHFHAKADHALNAVSDGSGDMTPPVAIGGLLSTPAWFNGKLYVLSGYNGQAKAFTLSNTGSLVPASQTSIGNFGYLPGSPSISANGTQNGIVWLLDRQSNQLHAYNAATLATELWNSSQRAGDNLGAAVKFAVPTVANGQVYVGASNTLVVYGLVQPPNSVPSTPILSATALTGTAINLSWIDPTTPPNTATSYTIETSTDGTNFSPAATAPAGSTSLAIGGLLPLTTYYFQIIGANSLGSSNPSNVAQAATTSQVAQIDFSGGFAGASGLTLNGSTHLNGSRLELTDGNGSEASSAFDNNKVDVTAFSTQFAFQISPGSDTADGFTFTIQGVGPTALGFGGGGLGYGPDNAAGMPGIPSSLAIKFDLYNNQGEGPDSTGLYLDGVAPTAAGSIDLSPSGIDLHSGDVFQVNMTYDGSTLTVIITDTQTQKSATQHYTVNIPNVVGDNSAYVGFTGGTGGLACVQDIQSWIYSPTATTSPNPPSGLGAIPASATSVQLSWTANASNQLGYHLDRASDAGFTQNLITESLPAFPSTFTDAAAGLASGQTFYYRLRAYNSVGDSDNSNTAAVTIPLAPPRPTNQQVTAVSTTEIDLTWQDNAGHLADGYKILRASNHGSFTQVATLPPTSRTAPSPYDWADTSLTPGTYYEYHILAFNVSGNNDFAGLNATTLPSPPGSLTALPGDGVITLTWTAPVGAQTFNVYRSLNPGGEGSTPLATGLTSPQYRDTAVTIGVPYYYTVTAVNANIDHDPVLPAESAPSNEAGATPTLYPGAPTGLTATASSNFGVPQIVLNWTAPLGSTSYNVYRSLSSNGVGATPVAGGLTSTSFTDSHVRFGTTYFYQVTAFNSAGEGPPSGEVSALPLFQVHINYTSSSGISVPGYLSDIGLAYGNRGNGLNFGWSRDDRANGIDRNAANAPDELQDSFHAMHGQGTANITWRLALPNGDYSVHLIAGDPADTTSLYKINVGAGPTGGVTAINGRASAASPWLENTVAITVTQGLLYVTSGSGAQNSKIDAIDITPLPPQVIRIAPAQGSAGTSITLTGSYLTGATEVQFNGLDAVFRVLSDTQIRATVPTLAATGPITVTTPGGTASSGVFLAAPRISSFTSQTGAPGDSIMITGANLTGATVVKINGLSASFTVDSATQLTALVPANATSGPITVTTRAGTATSASNFVVAPRITSFTPSRGGAPGAIVTLTGANFRGTTKVQFNGQDARFSVLSATRISAVVPANATTGPIAVTTGAGTAVSTTAFAVAPRISDFTARTGSAGDGVIITGVNFTGTTAVKFNGVSAAFTINSDQQITATVPNTATTGPITVTSSAGTATSSISFRIVPRVAIDPPGGAKGATPDRNEGGLPSWLAGPNWALSALATWWKSWWSLG